MPERRDDEVPEPVEEPPEENQVHETIKRRVEEVRQDEAPEEDDGTTA